MVALVLSFAGAAASRPARNLLIVTLDTTRADRLSAYGGEQAPVPNLERLCREGVRFDSAFTVSPVTLPSHASLLTGLYPIAHGVRNNTTYRLGEQAVTLAELLREQGIRTGAVVGSLVLHSRYGLDQGFEMYDDHIRMDRIDSMFAERRGSEVVDRGLEWLQEVADDRWFLWLHLFDPHWEYDPPEPFRSRHAGSGYDGEIAYADQQVGRVLDHLRGTGALDDTLVVVTSDHGESLGEHGEATHGLFLYDATTRVPLILRYPAGLPGGKVVMPVVRIVDVLPTALALMHVPGEGGFHGRDLAPLAHGRSEPGRTAWMESWSPRLQYGWSELTAIRDDRWKYVRAPRPELYDLLRDPREARNVLGQDGERAERWREQLLSMEEELTPAADLAEAQEPDPEMRRAMESLGYLSTAGPSPAAGDLPDPKDRVGETRRIHLVMGLVAAGRHEEAIAELQRLVRDNPRSPYLRNHLGTQLLAAGRFQEGTRQLHRSLELSPEDYGTLNELGTAYFEHGDLGLAEEQFRRELAVNPQVGVAYHNLGLIEERRGHEDGAIALYERALEVDPDLVRSVINLGVLYERRGRGDDALKMYLRAANLDPQNEKTFFSAGYLMFVDGRFGEALQVLDRAQRAHPGSSQPALRKAQVYEKMGDLPAAERELREAIRLDPSSDEARRQLRRLQGLEAGATSPGY